MKQYLDLLKRVLTEGIDSEDRTGTGTIRVFGAQLRFNLQEGFPIVTTKKIVTRSFIHELLWMLSGSASIQYLKDSNVHIWDAWADKNGWVGPMYGFQWRNWIFEDSGIDQLQNAIDEIKRNPYSRRLVVSAWNVGELDFMALYPCHILYQFHVDPEHKEISMSMYQRSADCFLGLPFDISLYALLLSMIGQVTGYKPKDLIISLGDVHIYKNHIEQVETQIKRKPYALPTLVLNKDIKNIDDFKFGDIWINNYEHHPAIKGEVSV